MMRAEYISHMGEIVPSPIRVNHGNVFNTGSWYTFHCPSCKGQVDVSKELGGCGHCGQELNWRTDEDDNSQPN